MSDEVKNNQLWLHLNKGCQGSCPYCRIAELEAERFAIQDFAIWLTGCGYDFTQHQYYMDNKHLLSMPPEAGDE
jgi:hypothetical protein